MVFRKKALLTHLRLLSGDHPSAPGPPAPVPSSSSSSAAGGAAAAAGSTPTSGAAPRTAVSVAIAGTRPIDAACSVVLCLSQSYFFALTILGMLLLVMPSSFFRLFVIKNWGLVGFSSPLIRHSPSRVATPTVAILSSTRLKVANGNSALMMAFFVWFWSLVCSTDSFAFSPVFFVFCRSSFPSQHLTILLTVLISSSCILCRSPLVRQVVGPVRRLHHSRGQSCCYLEEGQGSCSAPIKTKCMHGACSFVSCKY
jgi:hypothetical protein